MGIRVQVLQARHRVIIADARERRLDRFQLMDVPFNDRQFRLMLFQHLLDNVGHHEFFDFISSSNVQKAISGSSIQNSIRWRRVLDFSARNVGPKQ